MGWAPLEDTGEPAKIGDVIEVELQALRGGEEFADLCSPAYSCELGEAAVSEEFDQALIGSAVGEERSFDCSIGGEAIRFDAKVLRVRHQNIPELTDEWVREISKAESIEAWREHVKAELRARRQRETAAAIASKAVDALCALIRPDEVPFLAIEKDVNHRRRLVIERLAVDNTSYEEFLLQTGRTAKEFEDSLRTETQKIYRQHIALTVLARKEHLEATRHEVEEAAVRSAGAKRPSGSRKTSRCATRKAMRSTGHSLPDDPVPGYSGDGVF